MEGADRGEKEEEESKMLKRLVLPDVGHPFEPLQAMTTFRLKKKKKKKY